MIADLHASLSEYFGFEKFRTGQEQTIRQLLNGDSSLAIFPTGSGKSLCYQLSALHLPHLTLVVSPLLALMKDQLDFLAQKGIAAASIDSTLSAEQSRNVIADVRSGKIKILMVSVERFKNERFRQFIQSVQVSMLVVDEAHCISEWGHNFRPDYLKLPSYRQQLNIPLVLLLTATATKKVKRDMAQRFAIAEPHIVTTGFYRNNLDLAVVPVASAAKDAMLLSLVQKESGTGIVYVTLQRTAEEVATFLSRNQVNAQAYHAGLENEKRQGIQAQFMAGKIQVVVATIAFGMGIDKSDICFVIHYDLPKSIENYSQEIGRAGRDGQPSRCMTLANLDTINTLENFVYGDTPELAGLEHVLGNIREEASAGQWELQIASLSNASNIRQLPLKTLLVQLELLGLIQPLYAYFAEFQYKFVQPKENILSSFEGERQSFLNTVFSQTRFKKVWGSLDFEHLYQNHACERDRVITALEYLHERNLIELQSKKMTEVFSIDLAALSDSGLGQKLHDYFVDKEQKEIKRIAALVRFFELDRCLSRNLALYFDDAESPEQCGHCSVCRGQVAQLQYSQQPSWPDDGKIVEVLSGLAAHMSSKVDQKISLDSYCRFLAGISVPLFSRYKVKQLAGFAVCAQLRYEDIRQKLKELNLA